VKEKMFAPPASLSFNDSAPLTLNDLAILAEKEDLEDEG
jgi:hypothetical protein